MPYSPGRRQLGAVVPGLLRVERLTHRGEPSECSRERGVQQLPDHAPAVGETGRVDQLRIGRDRRYRCRTGGIGRGGEFSQQPADELEIESRELAVAGLEVHPLLAHPRVGLGKDQQIVLERARKRIRRIDPPASGDGPGILASTMEHDDRRNGGGDGTIGHLHRVGAGARLGEGQSGDQRHGIAPERDLRPAARRRPF